MKKLTPSGFILLVVEEYLNMDENSPGGLTPNLGCSGVCVKSPLPSMSSNDCFPLAMSLSKSERMGNVKLT